MGKFNCPVEKARLTSKFGWRDIGRGKEWHQGVDLCSPTAGKKVPVYASASGKVTRVGKLGTYGNIVMILHNIDGKIYETNYAHLDSYKVKIGQEVKQGEQIGIMGNSGGSFGVHLHFEIHNGRWVTGQKNAVDPMKWIELNTYTPYKVNNPTPPNTPVAKKDYSKSIGYNAPKDTSKVFRIHTTAYKSKAEAEKAKFNLVKNGYLAYAEVIGDDKFGYRIQSGKYTTQKSCEQAVVKMLDNNIIVYASIIGSPQ